MADIAVVYDRVREDEKMLWRAMDDLGAEYDKVYAPQLSFDFHSSKPAWKVVIERCVSQSRGYAIATSLEGFGVEVVNPSQVIANCGDKLVTNALLARDGIPTPRTQVCFDSETALKVIEEMGYPVVMKPPVGSWGRLLSLIRDRDAAETVLEHKEVLGGYQHQIFYIQELVDKPEHQHRTRWQSRELPGHARNGESRGTRREKRGWRGRGRGSGRSTRTRLAGDRGQPHDGIQEFRQHDRRGYSPQDR
jgi:[lysine-biosynthesis-protein LysW]---L-2-aminoadipate ligase